MFVHDCHWRSLPPSLLRSSILDFISTSLATVCTWEALALRKCLKVFSVIVVLIHSPGPADRLRKRHGMLSRSIAATAALCKAWLGHFAVESLYESFADLPLLPTTMPTHSRPDICFPKLTQFVKKTLQAAGSIA